MCSITFFQVRKSWGFLFLSLFLSLPLSRLLSRFRSLTASFQVCLARSLLSPSVFCSLSLCHLVSRSRARALSLSLSLSLFLALFLSRSLSFTPLCSLRVSLCFYLCPFLFFISLSLSMSLAVALPLSHTHAHVLSLFPSLSSCISLLFSDKPVTD